MTASLSAEKRVVGTNQVKRALQKDKVKKVFIAKDAEKRIVKDIIDMCNEKGIEIVYVETMKKLGKQCNIDVSAASAALLK
ncbi:MAG: 50S ribosomal protein L7ae-like protein [Tissierellia bacterium]|nr:50S ribosomal protein L7ae-like protein [Tissierellia bacterium]